MKTQITKKERKYDLPLIVSYILLIIGISMVLSVALMAQPVTECKIVEIADTERGAMKHLIDFNIIPNAGNVYLKWTAKGQTADCIYLVLRSTNDKDFKTVGYKNGAASDPNVTLLYCFTDKNPPKGVCYYRIKQINWDLSVVEFQIKKIENPTSGNENNVAKSDRKITSKTTLHLNPKIL